MAVVTLYLWDFGDGYTSIEEEPEHSYLRSGTYTVTLTVWTDVGSTTTTGTVIVLANPLLSIQKFTLRFAVEASQGKGWSYCEGDDWVNPKDYYGAMLILDDNNTPRMLIEDEIDDWVWEDSTFDRVEFQTPPYIDKYYEEDLRWAWWRWQLSGAGIAEYYLDKSFGGNPDLPEPKEIEIGNLPSPQGTLGNLQPGFWGYGDNDALGYDTIYVRLPDDTDPDTKAGDYVHGWFWTEIDWEQWYKELVADVRRQQDKLECTESHAFTRPQEPENKGNSDYDENGYRSAQQIDMDVYVDGDLARPYASVENIPENGDIVFSGVKIDNARRLQFVLKGSASEIQVIGRNHSIVAKPKQGSRTERQSNSDVAELVLAIASYHISRNAITPLLNRVSGSTIDGDVTQTTGPDGIVNSAIQLNAVLNLLNGAVTGAYTVSFWRSTVAPVAGIAALPVLTQQGATFNNWQLMYVTGVNCPANLVVSLGTIFDLRIYSSDITTYLEEYYNDVRYNPEPKQFLPGM